MSVDRFQITDWIVGVLLAEGVDVEDEKELGFITERVGEVLDKVVVEHTPVIPPIPEKDGDLVRLLLKGIVATWGARGEDFPGWRDTEYARGQLELVIEVARVITDEEYAEGAGDIDEQRDRITHWIRTEAWK